jgi:hypothetical protein
MEQSRANNGQTMSTRGRAILILTRRLMASKEWRKGLGRWTREGSVPLHKARLLAETVLVDADAWKFFRQLRNHLEKFGLTRSEALDRIVAIARTERAHADGSETDATIARLSEKHGRAAVSDALGISREEVKKRISAAGSVRRSALKKDRTR